MHAYTELLSYASQETAGRRFCHPHQCNHTPDAEHMRAYSCPPSANIAAKLDDAHVTRREVHAGKYHAP